MTVDVDAGKAKLRELMAQRDALEREATALSDRLTAPGQPGLTGGLIDKDGYPRSDIDIPAIRRDRHRLACINTDHRLLSNQIEDLLVQVHAAARAHQAAQSGPSAAAAAPASGTGAAAAAVASPVEGPSAMDVDGAPGSTTTTMAQAAGAMSAVASPAAAANGAAAGVSANAGPPEPAAAPLLAFAVVDEVTAGSPADTAGIQVGDRMCRFGDVAADAHSGELPRVAQLLAASEGQAVGMTVLRHGQPLQLTVTPQRWSGRGLLGCHLQPLPH